MHNISNVSVSVLAGTACRTLVRLPGLVVVLAGVPAGHTHAAVRDLAMLQPHPVRVLGHDTNGRMRWSDTDPREVVELVDAELPPAWFMSNNVD
jgi:hypothetical protein